MVRINLEVRLANTMEGVPEYSIISKKDALMEGIDIGLSVYYTVNKEAEKVPFQVVPSKQWNDLPETLYLFREDTESEQGICALVKEHINFPTAIAVPIYILFPPGIVNESIEINVMPTMVDMFKYD